MKINIIKTLSIALLIGAMIAPVFTYAQEVPPTGGQNTGGASIVSASVPPTGGQSTGGADSGTPSTGGQNTGGADAGVPSTGGQNTGGASVGGGSTAPVTPTSPNGSGPVSGSSVSSVSVGGGASSPALPQLISVSQCAYLTSPMKMGGYNSVDQVTKLQSFLKYTEGMKVDITGKFDEKTLSAVKDFQIKYSYDILAPWGISNPTGHVYHTTLKKINEIYCKTSFTLSSAQKSEIESYKIALKNPTVVTTPSSQVKDTIQASSTDSTQTATVVKTSIARKVWNFIKHVFGR